MVRYAFLASGILLFLVTIWSWHNYLDAMARFEAKEQEYREQGYRTNRLIIAVDWTDQEPEIMNNLGKAQLQLYVVLLGDGLWVFLGLFRYWNHLHQLFRRNRLKPFHLLSDAEQVAILQSIYCQQCGYHRPMRFLHETEGKLNNTLRCICSVCNSETDVQRG